MDINMITVQRTLDVGYCLKILTNPAIKSTIKEDGATNADLNIDVLNDYWVEFLDGDKELGVAFFHPIFGSCCEAHIHVLPEFRKEYSIEIGKSLWNWVENNLKDSLIVCNVPAIYPNVKSFLLTNDFKEVGTLDGAFLKDGKKQDVWIMQKRTR
jgi:hypothetical protein